MSLDNSLWLGWRHLFFTLDSLGHFSSSQCFVTLDVKCDSQLLPPFQHLVIGFPQGAWIVWDLNTPWSFIFFKWVPPPLLGYSRAVALKRCVSHNSRTISRVSKCTGPFSSILSALSLPDCYGDLSGRWPLTLLILPALPSFPWMREVWVVPCLPLLSHWILFSLTFRLFF